MFRKRNAGEICCSVAFGMLYWSICMIANKWFDAPFWPMLAIIFLVIIVSTLQDCVERDIRKMYAEREARHGR